jgi:hypothetical protein
MPEIFRAERMNAFPISKDIGLPGPNANDVLKPTGQRIYAEVLQTFFPPLYFGHKQNGACNRHPSYKQSGGLLVDYYSSIIESRF